MISFYLAKSSMHHGKIGCRPIVLVIPFIGGIVLMIIINYVYTCIKKRRPEVASHSQISNRLGSVNETFHGELMPTKVKENYLKQRSISSKELKEISISST